MFRSLLILLIAAVLTACGPAAIQMDEPLPTPKADWTSLKFTQSGGIMGMQRSLVITRDGAWTMTDDRAKQTVTGKLSADDLSQLADLVATLPSVSPSGQGVCADCFIYSIEISSGQVVTVQADDVSLSGSGMEPLVSFLTSLMNATMK